MHDRKNKQQQEISGAWRAGREPERLFSNLNRHRQRSTTTKEGTDKPPLVNIVSTQPLTDLVDDVHEVCGVGEVAVVELQADSALVAVAVDVVDALGVEARRPADDAVHLVPLHTMKTENTAEARCGGVLHVWMQTFEIAQPAESGQCQYITRQM